jgi:hypothetical protein
VPYATSCCGADEAQCWSRSRLGSGLLASRVELTPDRETKVNSIHRWTGPVAIGHLPPIETRAFKLMALTRLHLIPSAICAMAPGPELQLWSSTNTPSSTKSDSLALATPIGARSLVRTGTEKVQTKRIQT